MVHSRDKVHCHEEPIDNLNAFLRQQEVDKYQSLESSGVGLPPVPKLDSTDDRVPMVQEKSEYDPCKTSKDICLNKGKCTNRDGDTAAKQTFMDPIELRAFKEKNPSLSASETKNKFLITIQYQCICPDGFIGEFCHITEEERSCEEDLFFFFTNSSMGQAITTLRVVAIANAIHTNGSGNVNSVVRIIFSNRLRSITVATYRSPCAGYSCMNASNCTLKYHEKENAVEAVCECPKTIELVQAKVTGGIIFLRQAF
ncbi:hypothetical protein COOONC_09598 [Cooperia oncophora]